MPALSGDPWRGLTKVQVVDNTTGNGRYVTISVEDVNPVTASGDLATWDYESPTVAVTIRCEWGGGGVGAPGAINSIQIQTFVAGASTETGSTWTVTPVGDSGVETRTLHFDLDPLNQSLDVAANRRFGMIEIVATMIRNSGSGATHYNLNSRGVAAVGPPALTTHSWARGYFRQRAVVSSEIISNVALGGAEPPSWAYPDQVFMRFELASPGYNSPTSVGVIGRIKRTVANGGALEREASTNLSSTIPSQVNVSLTQTNTGLLARIGNGMFIGSEAKDMEVELPNPTFGGDIMYAWATTGHDASWAYVSESVVRAASRMTVDPRITFESHLFQIDDPVYGTPPMSKNVSPAIREDAEFGFLSERAVNSRGEGLNGVIWTSKLWDENEVSGNAASPTRSRSVTGATQGGESGWADGFLSWDSTRPTGGWIKRLIIAGPAIAIGLETSNETTLTLTGHDPAVILYVAEGDPTRPGTHWCPGQQLTIGARFFRNYTPSAMESGSASVGVLRFNPATGQLQSLVSVSPAVWATVETGTPISTFAMIASPGDSDLAIKTFTPTQTSDFDTRDLYILATAMHNLASYRGFTTTHAMGPHSKHDIQSLTQSDLDDHIAQTISLAHPNGALVEARITFDLVSGHHHVGTDSKAIGDRGPP